MFIDEIANNPNKTGSRLYIEDNPIFYDFDFAVVHFKRFELLFLNEQSIVDYTFPCTERV